MPKLGKKPATPDARDFKLSRYLDRPTLPEVPKGDLGHYQLVGDWGVLGNSEYGDCVFAGADHEHMLWLASSGRTSSIFRSDDALSDYSAVTGFNPSDPNSDQGTDMGDAAKYRRKTGIRDSSGSRHKVGAYVTLREGDAEEHKLGVYLFGAVGMGFVFPETAWDQFDSGLPWDVVSTNAKIDGGHYVPIVGYDSVRDHFLCVTWGKIQALTPRFIKQYNDESFTYLSEEMLTWGKSLEGFNLEALNADIASLGGDPMPTPTPTPTPTPDPVPDPAPQPIETVTPTDQQLWDATAGFRAKRHVGCNKTAAKALAAWGAVKGLK